MAYMYVKIYTHPYRHTIYMKIKVVCMCLCVNFAELSFEDRIGFGLCLHDVDFEDLSLDRRERVREQ